MAQTVPEVRHHLDGCLPKCDLMLAVYVWMTGPAQTVSPAVTADRHQS